MSTKTKTTSTVCERCGRRKKDDNFFCRAVGGLYPVCKDCLTEGLDNNDPATIRPVMEALDVPFYEKLWIVTGNQEFSKDPAHFGPKSVIGKYLRKMHMQQYSKFRYADSDDTAALDNVSGMFDETPEPLYALAGDAACAVPQVGDSAPAGGVTTQAAVGNDVGSSPTREDRIYLIGKWGEAYTPVEWLKMEDMYTRYANEYELTVDREEVLRKMCKTSLKMDEAIDSNDAYNYKTLSSVFDSLRKSGSFTEQQHKEDRRGVIGSVGQLVQLCERDGGIIEQMPPPDDYPQDKIDLTINDYKQYAVNLLKNEPNISGLIESYVQKLEGASDRTDRLVASVNDGRIDLPDSVPDPEFEMPKVDESIPVGKLSDDEVAELKAIFEAMGAPPSIALPTDGGAADGA